MEQQVYGRPPIARRDGCDTRMAYVPSRNEGENACVIGPNEEIVVEITCESGLLDRWDLAVKIAEMLNDLNDNHVCNDRARRDRAQHFLLLVRENRITDNQAMETLSAAIDEAGVKFARAEVAELIGGDCPF